MPKTINQRNKILATALELFALHGYYGTSVNMIATEAKISQGLMYNFFSGKEELLGEIMSMAFEDIQKSMAAYVPDADPRKAIETHINATCAIIKERSHFWRLIHSVRLQEGIAGIMMLTYRNIVSHVTSIFENVFKQLGYSQPRVEALLFLSQIDGMVILYLQDETTPIDQMAKLLIKRYTA